MLELFKSNPPDKKKRAKKKINAFKNLAGVGIAVIDENDHIIKVNDTFKNMFSSVDSIGLSWDFFLNYSFKKERMYKSVPHIFKYRHDIHSDYIIHTNLDEKTGYRYCWIYKISSKLLGHMAQNRTALMESKKVDVYSLLEDAVYEKSGHWDNVNLNLVDTAFADDSYLYTNNTQAKKLINDYVELVYSLMNVKDVNCSANINLSRDESGLIISVKIENFDFVENDFKRYLKWNKSSLSLSEICNNIEQSLEDFYVSITLKNKKQRDISLLTIELGISDIDGVQWYKSNNQVRDA